MLADRVAIVTGGGQGVGQGIARALAARGATVAVVGRTASKLDATKALIEEEGGRCGTFVGDVKDVDAIAAIVEAVAQRWGRIDILVNNAQQVPLGALLEVTDDRFQTGFSSGPLATFRFMKACHPHLKASGDAMIINLTSSTTKRWDMAGYGAYAAVKSAIVSLTRAAAAEWGVDGIRALTVAPHAESAGLAWWMEANPDEAAAFFQTIPLRRIGECRDDIGVAVAALCGPEFRYLTGATIPLDGGQANFT